MLKLIARTAPGMVEVDSRGEPVWKDEKHGEFVVIATRIAKVTGQEVGDVWWYLASASGKQQSYLGFCPLAPGNEWSLLGVNCTPWKYRAYVLANYNMTDVASWYQEQHRSKVLWRILDRKGIAITMSVALTNGKLRKVKHW